MSNFRFSVFLVCTLFSSAMAQADDPACSGPDFLNAWGHNIRTTSDANGVSSGVYVPLAGADRPEVWGEELFGGPFDFCVCPEVHKTSTSGLGYKHFHIKHSLPITWVDENLHTHTLTPALVENYYDWEYLEDGYTKLSGLDLSKNCHGYSMSTDCWPDDGEYGAGRIVNDDYEYPNPTTNTGLFYGGSHSTLGGIEECLFSIGNGQNTGIEMITWVQEKFRASGVYQKGLDCSNPAQSHGGPSSVSYQTYVRK